MSRRFESLGPAGAIVAAAACPVCFPKLAAIGALFGLGVLAPFETYFLWGAQFLVLLTLGIQVLAYRRHRNRKLLSAVAAPTVLFFLALYAMPSEILAYVALAGIAAATAWSLQARSVGNGASCVRR